RPVPSLKSALSYLFPYQSPDSNSVSRMTSAPLERGAILTILIFLALSQDGRAQTSTWNLNADGNWNVAGNWSPVGIPNGVGVAAVFDNTITANRTVTLGSAVTLGSLTIQNTSFTYTITGSPAITLNNSTGDGIARVTLADTATTHQHVQTPL